MAVLDNTRAVCTHNWFYCCRQHIGECEYCGKMVRKWDDIKGIIKECKRNKKEARAKYNPGIWRN